MLSVRGLQVDIDRRPVLRGIDLSVSDGEVVALLGANGTGKTTLVRALAGLCRSRAERLELDGRDLRGMPPESRCRHGLVLVADGHPSFPDMTVEENLRVTAEITPWHPTAPAVPDEAYERFPKLAERRHQQAGTLSGGERQMLAIGRALLSRPRLLVLDEPSHGLAPLVVEQVADALRVLAAEVSILVVEQNLEVPRQCADRALVLGGEGVVVTEGTADDVLGSEATVNAYLGL